jgi:hypothetical protein
MTLILQHKIVNKRNYSVARGSSALERGNIIYRYGNAERAAVRVEQAVAEALTLLST